MKRPIILFGTDGWLALLKARLLLGSVHLLVMPADTGLAILSIVTLTICAILFYMRCKAFRTVFIITSALAAAVNISSLPFYTSALALMAAADAAIITALYMSKRVKNTFYSCRYVHSICARRNGEYSCDSHESYLAAFRNVR